MTKEAKEIIEFWKFIEILQTKEHKKFHFFTTIICIFAEAKIQGADRVIFR